MREVRISEVLFQEDFNRQTHILEEDQVSVNNLTVLYGKYSVIQLYFLILSSNIGNGPR